MDLYTATITLIVVMDPLGNVPLFLALLKHLTKQRRRIVILRETFIAYLILIFFLLFGKYLLDSMGISQPALSIAGGIILFLIAIKLIFPVDEGEPNERKLRPGNEPFIVPLAIPLVAGPSALAFVMLLASQSPHQTASWIMAVTLASATSAIILFFADFIRKILGDRGLIAIERLMGMILTTMAVQMFLTGIEKFFHLN
jgi:multiple antibiotic resistance protein